MANKIKFDASAHLTDMRGAPLPATVPKRDMVTGAIEQQPVDHLAAHFGLAAINGQKFYDGLPNTKKLALWTLTKKLQRGGVVELTDAESASLREAVSHFPPFLQGQMNDLLDGDTAEATDGAAAE